MPVESKFKCPYCGGEMIVNIDFGNSSYKKEVVTCDNCGKDFILHSTLEVIHDYNKVEEKK